MVKIAKRRKPRTARLVMAAHASSERIRVGKSRLHPLHFGLSVGIVCGLLMLALGLAATYYRVGIVIVAIIHSVFAHFIPTLEGSLYGLAGGFIHGFIGGCLVAWLYNWMEHVR